MTALEQARAARHGLSFRPLVLPVGVIDPDEPRESSMEPIDPLAGDPRRMLLFLARIHPIKCADVLLRAFAGLEDRECILVIAGGGDRSLVDSLRSLAGELGSTSVSNGWGSPAERASVGSSRARQPSLYRPLPRTTASQQWKQCTRAFP